MSTCVCEKDLNCEFCETKVKQIRGFENRVNSCKATFGNGPFHDVYKRKVIEDTSLYEAVCKENNINANDFFMTLIMQGIVNGDKVHGSEKHIEYLRIKGAKLLDSNTFAKIKS